MRLAFVGGKMGDRVSSGLAWMVLRSRSRGRSWIKDISLAMSGTASVELDERVGRMVLLLERRWFFLARLPWVLGLVGFVATLPGTDCFGAELS